MGVSEYQWAQKGSPKYQEGVAKGVITPDYSGKYSGDQPSSSSAASSAVAQPQPSSSQPATTTETRYVYVNPAGATRVYTEQPANWNQMVGTKKVVTATVPVGTPEDYVSDAMRQFVKEGKSEYTYKVSTPAQLSSSIGSQAPDKIAVPFKDEGALSKSLIEKQAQQPVQQGTAVYPFTSPAVERVAGAEGRRRELLSRSIYINASPVEKSLLSARTVLSGSGYDYLGALAVGDTKDVVTKKLASDIGFVESGETQQEAFLRGMQEGAQSPVVELETFLGLKEGISVVKSTSIGAKILATPITQAGLGIVGAMYATSRAEDIVASVKEGNYARALGLGATTAAGTMIISDLLPLRYGKVKLPTGKTSETLYRGVYAQAGNKAQPIIGIAKGEVKIGTPKYENLNEVNINKGYFPESALETKIVVQENVFKAAGLKNPQAEVQKTNLMLDIVSSTKNTQSVFIEDKLPRDIRAGSERGVSNFLEFAKARSGDILEFYGSYTANPQIMPELQRQSGDIDITLKLGEKQSESFAQDAAQTFRIAGDKVRISKEKPTLVESFKNQEWHHLLDIHYPGMDTAYVSAERAYGFKMSQRPTEIEGLPAMRLSEQGIRKGAASTIFQEETIGPEPHRIKDVPDFYAVQKTLLESKGDVKGLKKLEEWKSLWPKRYFKEPGEVRIDFYREMPSASITKWSYSPFPQSVSPSPSRSRSPSASPSAFSSPSISPSQSLSISPSPSPSKRSPSKSIFSSLSPSPSLSISPSNFPSSSLYPSLSPSPSPSPSPYLKPTPKPPGIPPLFLPPGLESGRPRKGRKRSKAYYERLYSFNSKLFGRMI